jgi:hypothetical protein
MSIGSATSIQITSVPAGYTTGSIELGVPFGGAIAADPLNPAYLYVSAGGYNAQSVLSVHTDSQTTSVVSPVLGTIGGIAVLGDGSLAITENSTSGTILRASDMNSDGDFLDSNEITELIAPILTDGFFTGAQAVTAPANAVGIPAGSLVVQTADGGTSAELLVVTNPQTTPAFQPPDAAFFTGFQYNGGLGFTPGGEMIMGEAYFGGTGFTGQIHGLVNTNMDEKIDAGESHVIVSDAQLPSSISDLTIHSNGSVFFGESSGEVKTFFVPADLLTGSASPETFATTTATYISTLRFDNPALSFSPGGGPGSARLYLSGYVGFDQATNLAFIEPGALSAVGDWELYR